METKITRASNGRGIAAQSTVEIIRAPGNMILDVTSTQNFPGVNEDNTVSGEIFHFGCWSADGGGVLVPGTLVEGKAHVSNIGEVTIDSLDPGFTDKGNNIGDIFMVKPTTGWANDMVEALQVTLNPDGTLKDRSITADKIDSTGWVTPTMRPGYTAVDGFAVRRIGTVVYIRGSIQRTAGDFPASNTNIAELEAQFRPSTLLRFMLPTYASTADGAIGGLYCQISTSGTMAIAASGTTSMDIARMGGQSWPNS